MTNSSDTLKNHNFAHRMNIPATLFICILGAVGSVVVGFLAATLIRIGESSLTSSLGFAAGATVTAAAAFLVIGAITTAAVFYILHLNKLNRTR